MKKTIVALATALLVTASAGSALADSIKGTLGITGKMGFIIPADSKVGNVIIETDPGFIVGGGVVYGFDNNAAFEMEITHAIFGTDAPNNDASLTDLAFGLQYRFTPENKLVPYLGAGLDILMPDMENAKVDTVIGAHIKGGVDYFFAKNLALTGELKITGGFEAEITDNAGNHADFDPSSVVGTVGVRVYFR